jgi:predicted transcriptional regulator of viral defense system
MITIAPQKMKKIDLIRNLEKYSTFNLKMFSEIIKKDRNYAKLAIYRLKKENLVFELEKNKYTLNKEPLIIASNILWPSYLSCWSALRYHNLTEQLPQTFTVLTTKTRKKKEINLENSKVKFIQTKPQYFFGYKKERYGDFDIFIAEKEKALIDSALFKELSFSEICEIIKNNKEDLDIDLLVGYLIKIKNSSLIKRFGFLLDFLGIDKYHKLKGFINYNYIPLDYALVKKGKKDKKWGVIKNVEL